MADGASLRRIVLVGFMGSGKSTVGPLLADRLGWRFTDMDERVVERDGRSIPRIFAESGEARFRELEAAAAEELLADDRVVIASGGGWAAEPGSLDEAGPGTVTVWLRVSLEEALRRIGSTPGARPLLAGGDPAGAARELLLERESRYARCDLKVDTDPRSAEDVSSLIEAILMDPPWNLKPEKA